MPKDPMVECLNFKQCQTMIRASQRGREHKYGVYDRTVDDIVYKTCPGG